MVTLTKGGKSANVVRNVSELPPGCGGATVTSTIAIHTLVRGLVDLDTEISKITKKLDLANLNLQKVLKNETQPDYATTVPENVRLANTEKVGDLISS
jgi:valyl-tRNA synthetase